MTTTTAPDLWPGMDRATPTARAWITVWGSLDTDTRMIRRHPATQERTAS